MLEKIPTPQELCEIMGQKPYKTWEKIEEFIHQNYLMDVLWNPGGKSGTLVSHYECKFRRSGRTLCALYTKEGCFGFLLIFGKAEREKFESTRNEFSAYVQKEYDAAHTYHDGKWVMLDLIDDSHLEEVKKLIQIKRKPNRKAMK